MTVIPSATGGSAPRVREFSEHVFYGLTKGLCGTCGAGIDARIHFRDGAVVFEKFCPAHGRQSVRVAGSKEWYVDALGFLAPSDPPSRFPREVAKGCPFDCGPCSSHQQRTHRAVIAPGPAAGSELASVLDVAGGERPGTVEWALTGPALSADLSALLERCAAAGVALVVAAPAAAFRDEARVRMLAERGAEAALGLDREAGAADPAFALLARLRVTTTVRARFAGADEDARAGLAALVEQPIVHSLEFVPAPRAAGGGDRPTIPDVHRALERVSGGRLTASDFVPSPRAHPHCLSVAVLAAGGEVPGASLARLLGRERLFAWLAAPGFPGPAVHAALAGELRRSADPAAARVADALGAPSAGPALRTVSVHAFMDAHDFDVARVMKCGIALPRPGGFQVPLCAHLVAPRLE